MYAAHCLQCIPGLHLRLSFDTHDVSTLLLTDYGQCVVPIAHRFQCIKGRRLRLGLEYRAVSPLLLTDYGQCVVPIGFNASQVCASH